MNLLVRYFTLNEFKEEAKRLGIAEIRRDYKVKEHRDPTHNIPWTHCIAVASFIQSYAPIIHKLETTLYMTPELNSAERQAKIEAKIADWEDYWAKVFEDYKPAIRPGEWE